MLLLIIVGVVFVGFASFYLGHLAVLFTLVEPHALALHCSEVDLSLAISFLSFASTEDVETV